VIAAKASPGAVVLAKNPAAAALFAPLALGGHRFLAANKALILAWVLNISSRTSGKLP
jgi:hypothetical protein